MAGFMKAQVRRARYPHYGERTCQWIFWVHFL